MQSTNNQLITQSSRQATLKTACTGQTGSTTKRRPVKIRQNQRPARSDRRYLQMATSAESERRVNEETRAAFPPGGPSETQPGAEPRPEAVVPGTNGLSPGSTEIAGRRPEGCASDDRPPISDRPSVPPNALQCYVITAPIRCFYRAVLPRPSDWRASSSKGAESTTCASFHYPRRSMTIGPSVGKAFRCVCLSVRLSVVYKENSLRCQHSAHSPWQAIGMH